MKAHLNPDGTLTLASESEVRIVRASHPKYAALMQLFAQRRGIALSATHAPAGYTHEHPMVIAGHEFYGGQFVPAEVVAEATPEEKKELKEGPPEAKEANQGYETEPEHKPEPGYGGHPWHGGTPEKSKVYHVPIEHLHRDPERFQYKQSTNAKGVTGELSDVKWNPDFAGVLSVWQDPVDKKTYVVNGHHRLELGERSGVSHMAVRYLNAKNAQEARAAGALINIAEGRGTALDAAKFMRDAKATPEDLAKRGVSIKGKIAADASSLVKLNDRLFQKVNVGEMEQDTAVAIAKHLPDHNLQDQLANYLDKKKQSGKEYAPKIIESMAKEMAATPTHETTEHTLFGDITSEDSLFGERNELKQSVRNELAKSVNHFKAVSSQGRAAVLEEHGNTLDVEGNKKIAEENQQTLAIFDKLVNSKGPISEALNNGAMAVAKAQGKKAKDAARNATIDNVRAAVEREGANPGAAGPAVQGGAGAPPGGTGKLPASAGDGERRETQSDGLTPDEKRAASKAASFKNVKDIDKRLDQIQDKRGYGELNAANDNGEGPRITRLEAEQAALRKRRDELAAGEAAKGKPGKLIVKDLRSGQETVIPEGKVSAPQNDDRLPDRWWENIFKAREAARTLGVKPESDPRVGDSWWNDEKQVVARVQAFLDQEKAAKTGGEQNAPKPPEIAQSPMKTGDDQTPLPDGWSIKKHGKGLGLYREGRKTPVAKGKTREELIGRIAGAAKAKNVGESPKPVGESPNNVVPSPTKSKGHVAFVGKHEYYQGAGGKIYKATIGGKISAKTGNRSGTISSMTAMKAHEKTEAKKAAKVKGASPAPQTPATDKNFPITLIGDPGHQAKQAEAVARLTVPHEAQPKEPLFTGETVDSLGRRYHWVDGVRVPGPEEPKKAGPSISLAEHLADRLGKGETITASELFSAADEHHGGTRAEGKYGPSDAYDSLEAGFNMALKGHTDPTVSLDSAIEQVQTLAEDVANLPTQTNRSGNKDSHQQFSTPPHYAYAVNWLANLNNKDTVLEPSAGTGDLAIHAENAGAKVVVNEKDPKRVAFLNALFGPENVHEEDGEQIGAILPGKGIRPTAVVMNPPFSQTAGRLGNQKVLMTGANHISEALESMQPGGRLVAIVAGGMARGASEDGSKRGAGMSPDSPTYKKWFAGLAGKGYTLRANVGVGGGEYKKYGTHFGTRTLIIDKVAPDENTPAPVLGDAEDIPDLMRKLEGVRNDRPTMGTGATGDASGEPAGQGDPGEPRGGAEPGSAGPLEPGDRAPGEPADDRPAKLPRGDARVRAGEDDEDEPVPGSELSGDESGGTGSGTEDDEPVGPSGVDDPGDASDEPAQPAGRGGKRGGRGGGSRGKSLRGYQVPAPQLRPAKPVVIEPAQVKEAGQGAQSGQGLFDAWSPQTMHVPGSVPHITPLVESAAMSAVRLPKLDVKLLLSPDLVTYKEVEDVLPDGRKVKRNVGLTQAGLEQVAYMVQANETFLPSPEAKEGEVAKPSVRRGMMSGDGTGCVAPWTKIFNPLTGISTTIEELALAGMPHVVLSLTPDGLVPRLAHAPFLKGVEKLYRVTLESGRVVTVTGEHRFLTPSGWFRIDDGLRAGHFLACAADRLPCTSDALPSVRREDDRHSTCTTPGYQDDYRPCFYSCGEPLRVDQGSGQGSLPLPVDALERNRPLSQTDDRSASAECSRLRRSLDRHSRSSFSPVESRGHALSSAQYAGVSSRLSAETLPASRQSPSSIASRRSGDATSLRQSASRFCGSAGRSPRHEYGCGSHDSSGTLARDTGWFGSAPSAPERHRPQHTPQRLPFPCDHPGADKSVSSSCDYDSGWDRIRGIEFVGIGPYFDMYVPGPENYVAEGIIHHNTGKGRQVAGVIAHNMNHGRKKHVWVSLRASLIKDARRDCSDLGIDPNKVIPFEELRGKEPPEDGIVFVTYSTLRSGPKDKSKPDNLQTLLGWMGDNFDGTISFDEAHAMSNGQQMEGEMGKSDASLQALAGMKLQEMAPNARVNYWSATGATEVENLAYAERLGLWGPGTQFKNKMEFIQEMRQGGVAAMEAVAQSAKATGAYNARTLSMNDGTPEGTVVVKPLEHQLKDHQRATYDAVAEGWQNVLLQIDKVLESTNADKNKNAKGAANSQFWGAQQRFFNQMLTGMQTESVIASAKQDIKEGRAPVIQLVNTMEASTNRALAKRTEDQTLDDVDISPREILQNYLEQSFPIHRYETYLDSNGNELSRPVRTAMKAGDKGTEINGVKFAPGQVIPKEMADFAKQNEVVGGDLVEDPAAVAMRDSLIEKASDLHIPESPLDQLVHAFGDRVAEVTGRKQRFVWVKDKNGNTVKQLDRRSGDANAANIEAFQNSDAKDLLVFSGAGNTGASYHADKRAKNQKQRVHYVLQPGWSAAPLVQSLGRSHRTNQSSAPIIRPVAIPEVPGNKRFLSSAARRLEQMGALTRGQKQAASGGLYAAADNLESEEAQEAVDKFFNDLKRGGIEGMEYQRTMKELGFKTEEEDKKGNKRAKAKPAVGIRQFLNRLLALKLDTQNKVFDEFDKRHKDVIDQHEQDGTLAHGVEEFPAQSMTKTHEEVIHRDPASGAETKHVVVKAQHRTEKLPFNKVDKAGELVGFVRNKRSEKVWAVYKSADRTDVQTGRVTPTYRLMGPTGMQFANQSDLWQAVHGNEEEAANAPHQYQYSKFLPLSHDSAKKDWQAQHDATPPFTENEEHFVTGALLPVWGRLKQGADEKPRIYRLKIGDQNAVGRHIKPEFLDEFRTNFGLHADSVQHDPAEVHRQVESGQGTARLANGWRIAPVKVQGERRLEIKGFSSSYEVDPLVSEGVIKETIAHQRRFFVPVGKAGQEVLRRITASNPITQVETMSLSQSYDEDEPTSLSLADDISDEVRMEAIRNLREMFPLEMEDAEEPQVIPVAPIVVAPPLPPVPPEPSRLEMLLEKLLAREPAAPVVIPSAPQIDLAGIAIAVAKIVESVRKPKKVKKTVQRDRDGNITTVEEEEVDEE